jgi:hypothetical protein
MVLAKRAGRKTQTRRVLTAANSLIDGGVLKKLWDRLNFAKAWVDPGPSPAGNPGPYLKAPTRDGETTHRIYPRSAVGDRLWGRETFQRCGGFIRYKADEAQVANSHPDALKFDYQLKPSIFMPRWASRILDQVVAVRPERLQDISEADAIAEGLEQCNEGGWHWPGGSADFESPRACYWAGWDSINGKGAAAENPWVWVITTKAVQP